MGPIIQAIDEGHCDPSNKEHKMFGKCKVCGTKWPCAAMMKAKHEQVAYAEKLMREERHRKAIDQRSVYVY